METVVACVNDPPYDTDREELGKFFPHPLARLALKGDSKGVVEYLNKHESATFLESKNYALFAAAIAGNAEVGSVLLAAGADPNACGFHGSVLHHAVQSVFKSRNPEEPMKLFKTLVEYGAARNFPDRQSDSVDQLIQAKCDSRTGGHKLCEELK